MPNHKLLYRTAVNRDTMPLIQAMDKAVFPKWDTEEYMWFHQRLQGIWENHEQYETHVSIESPRHQGPGGNQIDFHFITEVKGQSGESSEFDQIAHLFVTEQEYVHLRRRTELAAHGTDGVVDITNRAVFNAQPMPYRAVILSMLDWMQHLSSKGYQIWAHVDPADAGHINVYAAHPVTMLAYWTRIYLHDVTYDKDAKTLRHPDVPVEMAAFGAVADKINAVSSHAREGDASVPNSLLVTAIANRIYQRANGKRHEIVVNAAELKKLIVSVYPNLQPAHARLFVTCVDEVVDLGEHDQAAINTAVKFAVIDAMQDMCTLAGVVPSNTFQEFSNMLSALIIDTLTAAYKLIRDHVTAFQHRNEVQTVETAMPEVDEEGVRNKVIRGLAQTHPEWPVGITVSVADHFVSKRMFQPSEVPQPKQVSTAIDPNAIRGQQ